jgi:hypothetical protein
LQHLQARQEVSSSSKPSQSDEANRPVLAAKKKILAREKYDPLYHATEALAGDAEEV